MSAPSPRPPAAPPTVLALLLAARVHRDPAGHGHVVGTFNGDNAPAFPAEVPPSFLDLVLTGGHGPTPPAARLADGADDAPPLLAFDRPTVEFASPLEVREFALHLPPRRLPAPGVLRWQVACGGAVVYERRCLVERRATPGRLTA
jgi:hypothetical protein